MRYKLFFCFAALLGLGLLVLGIYTHSRYVLVLLATGTVIFGALTDAWRGKVRHEGLDNDEFESHSNDESGRPK